MKKIIVIGCSGSGKSTFARELHKRTGIPLYHLDMMYWNADKTVAERDAFLKRLNGVLFEDAWIVDGNYSSTMELRMTACDTVVFLDYPPEVCLDGVRARIGQPRSDMPWTESEEDGEFLKYIKSYNAEQRPRVFELMQKFDDKNIIVFKSRKEADEFLTRVPRFVKTES